MEDVSESLVESTKAGAVALSSTWKWVFQC